MVSTKGMKRALATAVAAGFMSFSSQAQTLDADVVNASEALNGGNNRTELVVQRGDEFPTTPFQPVIQSSLKFKYPPAAISRFAWDKHRVPPVQMVSRPINLEDFQNLVLNTAKNKQGAVFIGVVVDARDPNWREGKIKDVQELAQYIVEGDVANGKPGLAYTEGATIQYVIPIAYDPTDRVENVIIGEVAEDGFHDKTELISVEEGEILTVMNNHVIFRQDDGHFITGLEDFYYSTVDHMILGRHSVSADEYDDIEVFRACVDAAVEKFEMRKKHGAYYLEDSGLEVVRRAGLDSENVNYHYSQAGDTSGSGDQGTTEDAAPTGSLASNGL